MVPSRSKSLYIAGVMRIAFTKMHGLGNDFVVLDGRDKPLPPIGATAAAALSDRRTGIGCDQLILMEPSEAADFRMRIFNADGGEVEACGNASRAVGLLHGEPAPQNGGDPQDGEEVSRHVGRGDPLGIAVAAEGDLACSAMGRDVLETSDPLPPVENVRGSRVGERPPALGIALPEGHEPLRVVEGQRAQDDGMDHGEDRGDRGDSYGYRRERYESEKWAPAQNADAVLRVLPQVVQRLATPSEAPRWDPNPRLGAREGSSREGQSRRESRRPTRR